MVFPFRSPIRFASLAATALLGASAHAIVGGVDEDITTSVYRYMGTIGQSGSFPGYGATPISSNWLVTANHIAPSVGATYASVEGTFLVTSATRVGTSDLSLVHIDNGTTGTGLSHFYGYTNLTTTTPVTLVGSGFTGTSSSTGYTLGTTYPSKPQIGQNTIDNAETINFLGGDTFVYEYDLDGNGVNSFATLGIPSNAGVPGEAGIGDKDSGSGWFVQQGGQTLVVAVSTGVADLFSVTGNGSNSNPYNFGDAGVGTSLGAYAQQITRITGVAPVPEPSAMAALALGALALLRRRRA